jgi:hypothetical protein
MKLRVLSCWLVLVTLAVCQDDRSGGIRVPAGGWVPDGATAIKIAEASLIPVYGEEQIASERPLDATLKDDVWTVESMSPCANVKSDKRTVCYGGEAVVKLSKLDARVLFMTHYK